MREILEKTAQSIQRMIECCTNPSEVATLTSKLLAVTDRLSGQNLQLWDIEKAAAFLGIKPDTLRKMAARKKIPSIKIGSLVRFDAGRLRRWALARETKVAEWHR